MDDIQRTLIKAGRKDLAKTYYEKIKAVSPPKFSSKRITSVSNEAVEALLALKNILKKGAKPLVREKGKDILTIATGDRYSVKVKVLGWDK